MNPNQFNSQPSGGEATGNEWFIPNLQAEEAPVEAIEESVEVTEEAPVLEQQESVQSEQYETVAEAQQAGEFLAVSEEEAMNIGKMDQRSREFSRSQELRKEAIEKGEVSLLKDLSPEQCREANREVFRDMKNRMNFILECYPQIKTGEKEPPVPDSILEEYRMGTLFAGQMRESAMGLDHGRAFLELPNGAIISDYSRYSVADYAIYSHARELNDQVLSQEALTSFAESSKRGFDPKGEYGYLAHKFEWAENSEQVESIREELRELTEKANSNPDLDIVLESEKLNSYVGELANNRVRSLEQREAIDRLWEAKHELDAATEELDNLSEEYARASLFKKAHMLATGYKSRLAALQSKQRTAGNRFNSYNNSFQSNHYLSRWNPGTQSYQKDSILTFGQSQS